MRLALRRHSRRAGAARGCFPRLTAAMTRSGLVASGEGLGVGLFFLDEAADEEPEIDDRSEHAALEASPGEVRTGPRRR